MSESLKEAALRYHAEPTPGKIAIEVTTPAQSQRDLALAYSPGVAEPVRAIAEDPEAAYKYTAKGNLVAVISTGSAILGLGNLGPLASKPVMEGKALLFKRFANVDSVDIEVDAETPEQVIDTIVSIANTFGGINLEDIRAPECFEIEKACIERCDIPVFHDDQHGTAIVTVAGLINALEIQGKKIEEARLVCLGAGAAAIACCELAISAGLKRENIRMLDSKGVIHSERTDLNEYKRRFANESSRRTLDDAMVDADVFLGLSGANLLSPEQLKMMAPNPVVFACSNPDPEIAPALAHEARSDLIMATGRSDFPNQVNNVLGFPFIFRGALDVRASRINEEMKLAAAHALAELAKEPVPAYVEEAYGASGLTFGPDYIVPKPVDERLMQLVAPAVAQAAIDSGVARIRPPQNELYANIVWR